MQFSSHKEMKDGAGRGPAKRPKLRSNSGGSLSDGGEGSAEQKQIEGYYMFPPLTYFMLQRLFPYKNGPEKCQYLKNA